MGVGIYGLKSTVTFFSCFPFYYLIASFVQLTFYGIHMYLLINDISQDMPIVGNRNKFMKINIFILNLIILESLENYGTIPH